MITGKEDISKSSADCPEGTKEVAFADKTIRFAHEAGAGETVIDLQNLNVPSSFLANSAPLTPPSELAAVNLYMYETSLVVVSSAHGVLQEDSYKVIGGSRILLTGNKSDGTLEGEIISGRIKQSTTEFIVGAETEKPKTFELGIGQTVLALGKDYPVGENITEQIGALRVRRNGVSQARNENNAASPGSLALGNYREIDSGNGFGTTIEFNIAPTVAPEFIEVEFGRQRSSGDLDVFNQVERVNGAFLAFLEAAGPGLGINPADILVQNPSEVEQRLFATTFFQLLQRMTARETYIEEYVSIVHSEAAVPSNTDRTLTGMSASRDTKGGLSTDKYTFQRNGSFVLLWRGQFGNNNAGFRSLQYRKNGGGQIRILSAPGIASTSTTMSAIAFLDGIVAGDEIDFILRHATGVNENISNWITIFEKGNAPVL